MRQKNRTLERQKRKKNEEQNLKVPVELEEYSHVPVHMKHSTCDLPLITMVFL